MAEPLGNEPLQYRHMNRAQQSTANAIVSDFGSNFSAKARTAGQQNVDAFDRNPIPKNAAKRAKGRRLLSVADAHVDKPMTLRSAADNRVGAVERAAGSSHRLPGETLAGAGWYHDAHSQIQTKAHGVPFAKAAVASSIMSPGADPDSERAATGALAQAHSDPSAHVNFSAPLVQHLSDAGHDVSGVTVGESRHISQVPSHLVPAIASAGQHLNMARHSTNINWAGINKVSSRTNIEKATKVMSGETPVHEAQNPFTAPKTSSYTDNIVASKPGTPEHMEYTMRADDLASKVRGDMPIGQGMLDYHGLRGSNTGTLSNRGHTAEDSWMRAVSVGHTDPKTFKGAGDISPGTKTFTDSSGVRTSVSKDPRISGEGVYHAWNNEATHRAAKTLQKKYDTDYTVPSTLVQETSWTQTRREVGADPDFNKVRRTEASAAKTDVKAATPPRLPKKLSKAAAGEHGVLF